ncbi:unnamed protein product [Phytomonas sp. Hart1]|nr:unnamed protein product [Phytomonas sp. Hart1]|eukprot:CCW69903.1 unnamed protein product [Phytomonas sp. isolate Hart1]
MRGIAEAFARTDQTLLTPFQVNLVVTTLRRVGVRCSPAALALPEADAISPESLLNVLTTMQVGGMRDERKVTEVIKLLPPILDECSPSQIATMIHELGRLQCADGNILARLARRLLTCGDSLSVLEVSLVVKALATSRVVPAGVLRSIFTMATSVMTEFQPEDYANCLDGLMVAGGQYSKFFNQIVEGGLNYVENMDAETLSRFIMAFTVLDYKQTEHVDIFADALVDLAEDLREEKLVDAFIALQKRNLLVRGDIFAAMMNCLVKAAPVLHPRLIGPVIEVCSQVPHNSDVLMGILLDRAVECVRVLPPFHFAGILDAIAFYPPARTHPIVGVFGRQAKLRVELMSPPLLAMAARGLATLGYDDSSFYTLLAETGFRLGVKDWWHLEPILMGLSIAGECPVRTAKVIASHLAPMARSMSVSEIQRVSRYLGKLHCEEEYVYRALASRMIQFVKEITPDMPEELQVVLQKGAIVTPVGNTEDGSVVR